MLGREENWFQRNRGFILGFAIAVVVLNIVFVYFVLNSTSKIEKMIGEGGIYILRKFFGIIP